MLFPSGDTIRSSGTRKLADGEQIDLLEFPLAPDSGVHSAIQRTLAAPETATGALEVVLADAMRPPFTAGSFDLIVTPWLLDVIDGDTGHLLRLVNRLLPDGGQWVFHGSLAFQRRDPAENINLDELLELTRTSGFEIGDQDESLQPYLDCPESRHGRQERILTFAATKGPA